MNYITYLADLTLKEAITVFKEALYDYQKEYNKISHYTNFSYEPLFRTGICSYLMHSKRIDSYGRASEYGLMDFLNVFGIHVDRVVIDIQGKLDKRVDVLKELCEKLESLKSQYKEEATLREIIMKTKK